MAFALLAADAPRSAAYAQTSGITGVVTDAASARPVVDARIFVPGTALSVFTDDQGRYVLGGLAAGTYLLRIERTGYATTDQTVLLPVNQTVQADFDLQVSAVPLDALVVTAAGTQRRRELGNAAVSIQVADELRRASPPNITSLLQGRATGVQVLTSSGSVGTASSIKIRGNGSIALGDAPLIYVDGARVSNDLDSGPGVGGQGTSRLNDINLDDIESIEIVKGPSAATLYGVEAAAGVIRITTKRGRAGGSEWTFRSEWGASWDDTAWPKTVWNPRAFFGELLDVSDLFAPGSITPGTFFATIPDTLYTVDLLSGAGGYPAPWRTGYEQTYSASLRGGSGTTTYFLSGEFRDANGTLSNNESTQRSLRANFNLLLTPELDVALSTSYANNRVLLPDNDNSTFGYIGVGMLGSAWGTSIRRNDVDLGGEFATCPLAYEMQRAISNGGVTPPRLDELSADNCPKNPYFSERTFDQIGTLSNAQDVDRFTVSITGQYRPLDFVTAKATIGYDHFSDQTGFLVPVDPELPFGDSSRGVRGIGHALNRLLTADANVQAFYAITPDIRSTTTVGAQFFRQKGESTGGTGRTLPLGSGTVSGAVRTDAFESIGESRTLGLFVEEQIGYRDRLFVTPAIRFDDSSAFGRNLGRAAYPRVMASYLISEESWFDGLVPGSFIESLRLRAAWGESGTQPAAFAALKLLDARRVSFNGDDVSGLVLAGPGNPELEAERGQEFELGFEANLFAGRVGVDFTWFYDITRDAIVGKSLAPSSGYAAPIFTNVGEMRNQGVELGLSGLLVNRRSVRWDSNLNVSTVLGEITKLDEPIVYGLGGDSQRLQQGYAFGSYFSRIYQIASNGSVAASDSAVYIGQPTPNVEGSLATSVTLAGWITLSANVGFAMGFQQFNSTEEFRCSFFGGGDYGGVCPELFEVDASGERTTEARLRAAASEDLEIAPWVEDGDFARLRNVSLRLELPRGWLGHVGAGGGNFTLSAENLWLLTGYSGLDPEVNFAGSDVTSRAEFFTLPPAKRVTGRLSISF
ncbi:MAG: SusC/RagA family TonB-linked outer membrane protein [Gemmatimonadales bacterium]